MIGKTVSHYKILEKLGTGGMGAVYLAEDEKLHRKVAIKFLPEADAADSELRRRFLHEAGAHAKLNHPNIATFYDVEESGNRPFIVMEYVGGRSLSEWANAESPSLTDVLDVAIQIGEGLQAAHGEGVVHRDIKPSNLMVTRDGKVKILDFGLARWRDASRITKTGTQLGTAAYMSPEQALGKKADHHSDIFSLGSVLYELACNRRPFEGDSEQATLHEVINTEPQPLARYSRDVPPSLEQTISKCLAKRPDERYQSVSDLLADLRRTKREMESGATSGISQRQSIGTRFKRHPRLWTAAAVILIAVVLVAIPKIFRITIEPDPGVSAAENSLAVMYFENLVNPEDSDRTSDILTSLLITNLSESEFMRVVNRQRLLDLLSQVGHGTSRRIDPATAKQVVEKAAVRYVVTGEILRSEPTLLVTATIAEAESGRSIGAHRVEASEGEDIFAVADRLSTSLRSDLNLPAATKSETSRPVAEVTTSSPEAYRCYLEGLDHKVHYNWLAAVESFRRAVAIDSTFATAHLALARLWQYDRSAAEGGTPPFELAMKYADHCSWREQQMIKYVAAVNEYEQTGNNKDQEAIRILEQIVERYPDDKEANYELGKALLWGYNPDNEGARATLERTLELDPQYRPAIKSLAYLYANNLKDFESALRVLNQYELLVPDEVSTYQLKSDILCEKGDYDEAIEALQSALRVNPGYHAATRSIGMIRLFYLGDYEGATRDFQKVAAYGDLPLRGRARRLLALVPLWRGQYQRGLDVLDQGIAADQMEGISPGISLTKVMTKIVVLMELGNWEAAETEVRPFANFNAMTFRDIFYIEVWARKGELQRADSALEIYRKNREGWGDWGSSNYWYLAGVLKEARGDFLAAAVCFDSSHSKTKPNLLFGSRFVLGRALLRTGELGRATELLRQSLNVMDDATLFNPFWAPQVHYYLGQAYEQSGWNDQAIEEYETFLDIWSEADSGLVIVDDARQRLAALKP